MYVRFASQWILTHARVALLRSGKQLHEILSAGAYDDIVAWLPHGQSFMIHKKRVFETEILGKFFKKSKFTSFTRKLNRWGFSRITRGAENGAYFHALFRRDQPRLCLQMSNRSGANASGAANTGKSARPAMMEATSAAAATPLMPFPMAGAAGSNYLFPGMYPFDASSAASNPFASPQSQQQQQNLLQQLQFQQLQLQQLQFQQQQQQMQAAFMQQHQLHAAAASKPNGGGEDNNNTNNQQAGSSDAQQLQAQAGGLSSQQSPNPGMAMMNNLHDWNMFQKFAAAAPNMSAAGSNPLGISNLFPPTAMMNSFASAGGMLAADANAASAFAAANNNNSGAITTNNNNNNNTGNNTGNNGLAAEANGSNVQAQV